jgi:hypothetical protein
MTPSVAIALPGGFFANGEHCREVHLRAPTAEEQVFLTEECGALVPAQWATEVLTRCIEQLGPDREVSRSAIRALTVGDREALLIHLRRLMTGDRLTCVLACPSVPCGERLELDLDAADLLLPCYDAVAQLHELSMSAEGTAPVTVRFRLPTGGDQEAAALLARTNPAGATDLLLRRCLQSVTPGRDSGGALPEALRDQVSDRMAELDPQAEITLRVTCPACGHVFRANFDTASFLMEELRVEARALFREIHQLAYHYHWSPAEILAMSARTRRRYLQLLEDELVRGAAQ